MIFLLKKVHYHLLCFIWHINKIIRNYDKDIYYPYKKIKQYKDKHLGKRCFIIGTGPSLDVKSLNLLKKEYTFSMNSIVLSFKDTEWRPTYYVIQDGRAYNVLKSKIENYKMNNIFIGISYRFKSIFINKIFNRNFNKYYYFPVKPFPENDIKTLQFSGDCYKDVCDGATITYSILQLAIYMGFKEIYLLGIDCDYTSNGKKNIVDYVRNTNGIDVENKMLFAYHVANNYANKHGIKIYNTSSIGKLKIFKFKNIKDVINT